MKTQRDTQRRLCRTGLILGIVGAGLSLLLSVFSCVANVPLDWSPQFFYAVFSWLWHWVILLIASKWALVGGSLLVLDGSVVVFVFRDGIWWLAPLDWLSMMLLLSFALLLMLSGVLFILSWGERRKSGN